MDTYYKPSTGVREMSDKNYIEAKYIDISNSIGVYPPYEGFGLIPKKTRKELEFEIMAKLRGNK